MGMSPAPKTATQTPRRVGVARSQATPGSSSQTAINLTSSPPRPSATGKRARSASTTNSPAKRSPKKVKKGDEEEKRLRRYRSNAPASFDQIYERALSQHFFVLSRKRTGTDDCPGEEVELAGTTGNVYTIQVGKVPSCNCPHAMKGNQCKHILYILARVLRAPFEYVYQLALLSSELRTIFENAPPIKTPETASSDKNRKAVEGDCPICFMELEEEGKEEVVWCRAACGQNFHKECFQTWAKTRSGTGHITCPLCRSVWQGDTSDVPEASEGILGEDGYVNVAHQLGISSHRDTSSYSEWFNRRERRAMQYMYGMRRSRGYLEDHDDFDEDEEDYDE